MKYLTSILSVCTMATLLSCGRAQSNDTSTRNDSLTANTDTTAATGDVRVSDSVFRTADLTLFDLMGHVKTCKQGEAMLRFDQDGQLTSYTRGGQNQLANMKREKGLIVQYTEEEDAMTEWASEYHVEWTEDNTVQQFTEMNMEGCVEYTYTYGTQDNDPAALPRILKSLRVGEGYNWSGMTTYTYLKFDEQHNWTERKATDELFCDYDGHQEQNETTTEKRVITYY